MLQTMMMAIAKMAIMLERVMAVIFRARFMFELRIES